MVGKNILVPIAYSIADFYTQFPNLCNHSHDKLDISLKNLVVVHIKSRKITIRVKKNWYQMYLTYKLITFFQLTSITEEEMLGCVYKVVKFIYEQRKTNKKERASKFSRKNRKNLGWVFQLCYTLIQWKNFFGIKNNKTDPQIKSVTQLKEYLNVVPPFSFDETSRKEAKDPTDFEIFLFKQVMPFIMGLCLTEKVCFNSEKLLDDFLRERKIFMVKLIAPVNCIDVKRTPFVQKQIKENNGCVEFKKYFFRKINVIICDKQFFSQINKIFRIEFYLVLIIDLLWILLRYLIFCRVIVFFMHMLWGFIGGSFTLTKIFYEEDEN